MAVPDLPDRTFWSVDIPVDIPVRLSIALNEEADKNVDKNARAPNRPNCGVGKKCDTLPDFQGG
jgi:hypothetical protein